MIHTHRSREKEREWGWEEDTHMYIRKNICIVIYMEVTYVPNYIYTYREGYKKEGMLLEVDEEEEK